MKIKIDIAGLRELSSMRAKIDRYPAAAAEAGVAAVNDVAETVITRASVDITQRYNLQASYVREKFQMRLAKNIGGVAIVAARRRGTRLARFEANQMTAAAPRAKGDAPRGIAAGRKQAGVSVKVRRDGSRKTLKDVFLLPLRAGKTDGGNGMGIFERYGKGPRDIEHLYGPSPDQAYQWWLNASGEDINRLLAKAYIARLNAAIRRGGE